MINAGDRVWHLTDLTVELRVTDVLGDYATCEWDDQGLPRRRVYRRADLVPGTAGRMTTISTPISTAPPWLVPLGLFSTPPTDEDP